MLRANPSYTVAAVYRIREQSVSVASARAVSAMAIDETQTSDIYINLNRNTFS